MFWEVITISLLPLSLMPLTLFPFAVKDAYDYQGRSYLHIPQDTGINLKSTEPPERCFIPKKLIHTWSGHSKGISAIRWFPLSAHLMLSCSMDCKVKVSFRLNFTQIQPDNLGEIFYAKGKRLIQTFLTTLLLNIYFFNFKFFLTLMLLVANLANTK